MNLAEIQAEFECLRDDQAAVRYRHPLYAISGIMHHRGVAGKDEVFEITISPIWDGRLDTARRRAYAILAMCDWMEKVRKEKQV